ncbi:MAG TPA: mechanosensitive ion channel domain-containing protein [Phycisphaerae bacterium]|nr:mechanosensitive ion channel domain-containing protein [Phycisphaerae bacterium]
MNHCLILSLLISASPLVQTPTSQPASRPAESSGLPSADATAADIETRLHEIEASLAGDSTTRSQLIELYRETLNHLRRADLLAVEAGRYEQSLQQAPKDLELARQRLRQLKVATASRPAAELPADATVEQVSQRLRQAEAELASRQEVLKKLEQEADRRSQRRAAIPQDLLEANRLLGEVARELTTGPTYGVATEVARARIASLKAQQRALEQQILASQVELRCYQSLDEVISAQQQEAAAAVDQAGAVAAVLRDELRRCRVAQATAQKEVAEKQLRDAPEAIRKLVLRTGELARESESLAQKIHRTVAHTRSADEAVDAQSRNLKVLRNAIEASSTSEYLGMLLARLGRLAKDPAAIEREIRSVDNQISIAQLRAAQLEEERQGLSDIDARTVEFLELLRGARQPINEAEAAEKIRQALRTNLDGIDRLRKEYAQYWDELIALKTSQNRLLADTRGYIGFIEERALWLPNEPLLHKAVLPARLFPEPGTITRIKESIAADMLRNPAVYIAAAAGFCLLIVSRRFFVRRLALIRERVQHPSTDSFAQTVAALLLEFLLILPGPCALGFLAHRIAACEPGEETYVSQFALAVSQGLHYAALQWVVFGFLRRLARRGGIAEVHLQWNAGACRRLHSTLTWVLWIAILMAASVNFSRNHPDPAWASSIGRAVPLLTIVTVLALLHVLLHPTRGVLATVDTSEPSKDSKILLGLAYVMLSGLAFVLMAAICLGYGTLGACLGRLLIRTIWLVLALAVLRSLLTRFVLVSQRKLALRVAQADAGGRGKQIAGADGSASAAPESWDDSYETIGEATRKILRWVLGLALVMGLWALWQPFIPAFSFVHRVELWSVATDAAVSAQGGAGGTTGQAVSALQSVTLADLLYAVIVAILTFVLAIHGPKVLEVTLLARLRLAAGERFAIASLTRYVVVLVGMVMSLTAIGIGWSKVQWLAAAVSVGLGFGLQEIFANFVSGLIILFERPIRIGDVVTVGGVDGRITRIRMRAVTVTDWNRRELIVPNKEFITGQIVNWTLSDSVTRVNVPVGIAYGSNTKLARDLLLRVARACPHVLQNPPPAALFKNFGDSTLDFELRVYIPNLDVWVETVHELHTRINDEFRAAGIEIAFPQRDLHIRSMPDGLQAKYVQPDLDLATLPEPPSPQEVQSRGD